MSQTKIITKQINQPTYPIIEPSLQWIRVRFGDKYIADTTQAVLLVEYGRGRLPTYYIKPADIKMKNLESSEYMGRGGAFQFWHVKVGENLCQKLGNIVLKTSTSLSPFYRALGGVTLVIGLIATPIIFFWRKKYKR